MMYGKTNYSTARKAVSAFTAAALAISPLGLIALTPYSFAYGDSSAFASAQAILNAEADGNTTISDELADELIALYNDGAFTDEEITRLLGPDAVASASASDEADGEASEASEASEAAADASAPESGEEAEASSVKNEQAGSADADADAGDVDGADGVGDTDDADAPSDPATGNKADAEANLPENEEPPTQPSTVEPSRDDDAADPSDDKQADNNGNADADQADDTSNSNATEDNAGDGEQAGNDGSAESDSSDADNTSENTEQTGDADATDDALEAPAEQTGAEAAPVPTPSYPAVQTPSSGTYTPRHYTHNLTTEKFIAVIGEQARHIAQENDLYASVMIAQAILESASGNSTLAQAPNNNLFGIKGSWNGQSVNMLTWEDDGTGTYYAIHASFRKYDTIMDSLDDYADLLAHGLNGYYKGAWKSNAETPADACDYLEGRYATSTTYSESLQDLIETYDLTRFDKPLDYVSVETCQVQSTDPDTGELVFDENGEPVMENRYLVDLVATATSYLGVDYVWGGASPSGFDCSGLVQYCYQEALGISLPRTTYYQWRMGETVQFEDLHMGDLLFFEEDGDVHHVAIYLGDGYYIHAPEPGDSVKVSSMEDHMPSFAQRIVKTRAVDDEANADDAQAEYEVRKSTLNKTNTLLSDFLAQAMSSSLGKIK